MIEEWRDVVGFEGLYEVSNLGRVKRLAREVRRKNNGNYLTKEKIGKINNNDRYPKIGLSKKGKSKMYYVHRLVAQAFIPNNENKREVNHINENKLDNRVENLEWVTPKENMRHSYNKIKASLQRGENKTRTNIDDMKALTIYTFKVGHFTNIETGKRLKLDPSAISRVRNGQLWKHLSNCNPACIN